MFFSDININNLTMKRKVQNKQKFVERERAKIEMIGCGILKLFGKYLSAF